MFRPGLKLQNARLSQFSPLLGTRRPDFSHVDRAGLKGLGTQSGSSRRRNDPVVERFQGRFCNTMAASLVRSHGCILS